MLNWFRLADRVLGDATMPDDKTKTDNRDRKQVAGEQDFEVQFFAQEAGISIEQARTLIERHGHDREKLHDLAGSIKRAS